MHPGRQIVKALTDARRRPTVRHGVNVHIVSLESKLQKVKRRKLNVSSSGQCVPFPQNIFGHARGEIVQNLSNSYKVLRSINVK